MIRRCVRFGFIIVLTSTIPAACNRFTDDDDRTESIIVVVDSMPTNSVGGVWLTAPNGSRTYSQVHVGTNTLAASARLGFYQIAFDTVSLGDTGTATLLYDGSRWTATPIALELQLDGRSPADSVRVLYRKVTGGIFVSSTGYDKLWVEFLHPDGTSCRCTSGGGAGLNVASSGASVQNLLPGEYQVHFLPITVVLSPHTPPPYPTYVPSPSTVMVTVRAGEIARASAVYKLQ